MSSKLGPCEYCSRSASIIDGANGVSVYVCEGCLKLLKRPETALPLIRGHLSIEGRDKGPGYKKELNEFMEMISNWYKNN